MKFVSWSGEKDIELLDCPFCGNQPVVSHIGNDNTKVRKIEIKCPCCHAKRTDAAMKHDFDWLEKVAVRNWNERI